VGGFFVLARLKLASKSDQKKKAERCGAADGFLSLFSWVQGHQRRVLSPLGEKSPTSSFKNLFSLPTQILNRRFFYSISR